MHITLNYAFKKHKKERGRAVEGELCTPACKQPTAGTPLSTTEAVAISCPP